MDVLFVFFISTGFVGGLLNGLRKTVKNFLAFFISICLTFLLLPLVSKAIVEWGILKNQLFEFFSKNVFCQNDVFSSIIGGGKSVESIVMESNFPSFLKEVLIKVCEISKTGETIGDRVINFFYNTFVILISFAILFIVFYIILKIVFSLLFRFKSSGGGLFFTKRFLSAFVGGIKGVILFVVIICVLCFATQITGLSQIEELMQNSSVAQIGKTLVEKNISAFISGIY